MKILVVTNLFPPVYVGGYELGCRDVVEKLRGRGHAVHVLTSERGADPAITADETDVERVLRIEDKGFTGSKWAECRKLERAVMRFGADVVYFWNLAGLCNWMPHYARLRGWRTAFFLSDTNFVAWRVGAVLARRGPVLLRGFFAKTFLVRGIMVVEGARCHFASHFLEKWAREHHIQPGPGSIVAHWGIDLDKFTTPARERWPVRKLLYAGQVIPEKGVHTAIAALALLAREPGMESLSLDIAGGCQYADYEKKLRDLASQPGAAGRVNFLGRIPRGEMREVYHAHDVLVFPSEWLEPFAITPLEAMTAGMAVTGTTRGGSGELFREGETATVFEAGDAQSCADAIRRLVSDRALFEKIRGNGAREVAERHTLDGMVDVIEKSLLKARR